MLQQSKKSESICCYNCHHFFINKMTTVDDNDDGELLKNFSQAVVWSDFLYRNMPLILVKM